MDRLSWFLIVISFTMPIGNCFPIGYYDPMSWDSLMPKLNMSIVDFCFYNATTEQMPPGMESSFWCDLVSNRTTTHILPKEFVAKLQADYLEYVTNEPHDRERVLNCFATTTNHESCWNVLNRTDFEATPLKRSFGIRESKARAYLKEFSQFANSVNFSLVDLCYYNMSQWNEQANSVTSRIEFAFCKLISDEKLYLANAQLESLQLLFADYVTNEKRDIPRVFEQCSNRYILNKFEDTQEVCWKVFKNLHQVPDHSAPITRREQIAQEYLTKFADLEPKLDLNFVDYCFYNESEWMADVRSPLHHFCYLISDRHFFMPDSRLKTLQDEYADYADNERNDRAKVLDCFVRYRSMDQDRLPSCLNVTKTTILLNKPTIRQEKARNYFEKLSNISDQLDYCTGVMIEAMPKNKDNPKTFISTNCDQAMLDQVKLAEHCRRYHRSRAQPFYGECEFLANPPVAGLPTTDRSISRYMAWRNATDTNEADEKRRPLPATVSAKSVRERQFLLGCLNTGNWIEDESHRCHNVTKQKANVHYSDNDFKLREIWVRLTKILVLADCVQFHISEYFTRTGVCEAIDDSIFGYISMKNAFNDLEIDTFFP